MRPWLSLLLLLAALASGHAYAGGINAEVWGEGRVSSDPTGLDCTGTCTSTFDEGSLVELVATPAEGWVFRRWDGACAAAAGPACTVRVIGTRTVLAVFVRVDQPTLDLSIQGRGTVTSTPSGLDCSNAADAIVFCAAVLPRDTDIELRATPMEGWRFWGWSVNCVPIDASRCRIRIRDYPRSVNALFIPAPSPTSTLTVVRYGSGRVQSTPTGIDCGETCSAAFAKGSTVRLQAQPDPGWYLQRWDGGCVGAIGTVCNLAMIGARTAVAVFRPGAVPPDAPDLRASGLGSHEIRLVWPASTDASGSGGVREYAVERCRGTDCTDFAPLAVIPTADLTDEFFHTYVDGGLRAGAAHRYRMRAVDWAGNVGAFSAEAAASAPLPLRLPDAVAQVAIERERTLPVLVPAGARNLRIEHAFAGDMNGLDVRVEGRNECPGGLWRDFLYLCPIPSPLPGSLDAGLYASTWIVDFDIGSFGVRYEGTASTALAAAGSSHACALETDGSVRCWGGNEWGQLGDGTLLGRTQPTLVEGLEPITHLAAGAEHTCAVGISGRVHCWGRNDSRQLGQATASPRQASPIAVPDLSARRVSAGRAHTCILDRQSVAYCWGDASFGQIGRGTSEPTGLAPGRVANLNAGIRHLVAGGDHTCVIRAFGELACWGRNSSGQLGTGDTQDRSAPASVQGLPGEATRFALGDRHTCAALVDGTVWCWGDNASGQIGAGDAAASSVPVAVPALDGAVRVVVAGARHTCAQDATGLACWGGNASGQLGDGTRIDRALPTRPPSAPGAAGEVLAAGGGHSCAVLDGRLNCWGGNAQGQLGSGDRVDRLEPTRVGALPLATRLASGGAFGCTLLADGRSRCWGKNEFGQLGQPAGTPEPQPLPGPALDMHAYALGEDHACALVAGGGVRCWGSNAFGQLGDGTGQDSDVPVTPAGLASGVLEIQAGRRHTCARLEGQMVWCWGDNTLGQLGDGTRISRSTPVETLGLPYGRWPQAIATRWNHSCALTHDGGLYCWGSNDRGQLGDGSTEDRLSATLVQGLPARGAQHMATGASHTCAVVTDGHEVFCWGSNVLAQLGDGSNASRTTPAPTLPLMEPDAGEAQGQAIRLSAGLHHTCALSLSNQLHCWGWNDNGRLGDGTTVHRGRPTRVDSLDADVRSVQAGQSHTCALDRDGRVHCWGRNDLGQLGVGDTLDRLLPTPVPLAE